MEQQSTRSIPQPPAMSDSEQAHRNANVSEEHLLKPSIIAQSGQHPAGPLHPPHPADAPAGSFSQDTSYGFSGQQQQQQPIQGLGDQPTFSESRFDDTSSTATQPASSEASLGSSNFPSSTYGSGITQPSSLSHTQQPSLFASSDAMTNQPASFQDSSLNTGSTYQPPSSSFGSSSVAQPSSFSSSEQAAPAPLARSTSIQHAQEPGAGVYDTSAMSAALPADQSQVMHPSALGTQSYFVPLDTPSAKKTGSNKDDDALPPIQPIEVSQFPATHHDDVIPTAIANRVVVGLPEASASNLGGDSTQPATGSPTFERRALTGERLVPTRIEKDALEANNPNLPAGRGVGYQTTNPSSIEEALWTRVDEQGRPVRSDDKDLEDRAGSGSISAAQAKVDKDVSSRAHGHDAASSSSSSKTYTPLTVNDMQRADTTTVGCGNTIAGDVKLMTESDSKPYNPWPNPMRNAGEAVRGDVEERDRAFRANEDVERDRVQEPDIVLVPSMQAPPRRVVTVENMNAGSAAGAGASPATIYAPNEPPRLPVLGQEAEQSLTGPAAVGAAGVGAAPLSMPYPAREEVELVSPGHLGQSDKRVVNLVPNEQGTMTGTITNPPY